MAGVFPVPAMQQFSFPICGNLVVRMFLTTVTGPENAFSLSREDTYTRSKLFINDAIYYYFRLLI